MGGGGALAGVGGGARAAEEVNNPPAREGAAARDPTGRHVRPRGSASVALTDLTCFLSLQIPLKALTRFSHSLLNTLKSPHNLCHSPHSPSKPSQILS